MSTMPLAIAFFGKSNSGKTTLTTKVIKTLTARGIKVGSIKHHGHKNFDIDIKGKDSWRHTQAGSEHTVVVSPDKFASYRNLYNNEPSLEEILSTMNDVELVVVEGYKSQTLIPAFELIREGNPKDDAIDASTRTFNGNAVITNSKAIKRRAEELGIPYFDINDIEGIVDKLLLLVKKSS